MIGMNGRDGTEATEMLVVEGHQIRDTMPHHRGDESCIMSRLPSYVVVRHELLPALENGSLVAKEMELLHDLSKIILCLPRCQAEPIFG